MGPRRRSWSSRHIATRTAFPSPATCGVSPSRTSCRVSKPAWGCRGTTRMMVTLSLEPYDSLQLATITSWNLLGMWRRRTLSHHFGYSRCVESTALGTFSARYHRSQPQSSRSNETLSSHEPWQWSKDSMWIKPQRLTTFQWWRVGRDCRPFSAWRLPATWGGFFRVADLLVQRLV